MKFDEIIHSNQTISKGSKIIEDNFFVTYTPVSEVILAQFTMGEMEEEHDLYFGQFDGTGIEFPDFDIEFACADYNYTLSELIHDSDSWVFGYNMDSAGQPTGTPCFGVALNLDDLTKSMIVSSEPLSGETIKIYYQPEEFSEFTSDAKFADIKSAMDANKNIIAKLPVGDEEYAAILPSIGIDSDSIEYGVTFEGTTVTLYHNSEDDIYFESDEGGGASDLIVTYFSQPKRKNIVNGATIPQMTYDSGSSSWSATLENTITDVPEGTDEASQVVLKITQDKNEYTFYLSSYNPYQWEDPSEKYSVTKGQDPDTVVIETQEDFTDATITIYFDDKEDLTYDSHTSIDDIVHAINKDGRTVLGRYAPSGEDVYAYSPISAFGLDHGEYIAAFIFEIGDDKKLYIYHRRDEVYGEYVEGGSLPSGFPEEGIGNANKFVGFDANGDYAAVTNLLTLVATVSQTEQSKNVFTFDITAAELYTALGYGKFVKITAQISPTWSFELVNSMTACCITDNDVATYRFRITDENGLSYSVTDLAGSDTVVLTQE